ncbi:CLUMA_CG015688, isoform A [Clunio marinus]|uniref:CLUMA_CG015688, isoform A n=1 Tax=Clunio marinus TaxID=568069 RepID=A0A1J1IQT5_9DIPT|nr:CLUMA_CG015688, isoform A [Clunio marinus]
MTFKSMHNSFQVSTVGVYISCNKNNKEEVNEMQNYLTGYKVTILFAPPKLKLRDQIALIKKHILLNI